MLIQSNLPRCKDLTATGAFGNERFAAAVTNTLLPITPRDPLEWAISLAPIYC